MEDIEMKNNNQNAENEVEDSFKALDDIQKELKEINNTFSESLMHIKNFVY